MIDIHCHILPGVDDGARSWEIAEEMCDIASRDGITHIVATPHANSQFKYDRTAHGAALDRLQARYRGELSFSLGCDFHVSYENTRRLFAGPAEFVISGTEYLLIELDDFSVPPNFSRYIDQLRSSLGVTPILTHPERHPILQQSPELLGPWISAGCLVQVTANSLTGHWGRNAQSAAMWLLENRMIHILASDAHDPAYRPPVLSQAAKVASEILGAEAARALVQRNPQSVVTNQPVMPFNH